MRLLPGPLSYRVCDLCRVIGLGKETAALRKVVFAYQMMARGHYYLDGRPAVADGMSEFETVYGAWHLNIRKDHSDVAAVLEYPYCFVSVCSFNNLEARILDSPDSTRRTSGSSSTMRTAGVFKLSYPTHHLLFLARRRVRGKLPSYCKATKFAQARGPEAICARLMTR